MDRVAPVSSTTRRTKPLVHAFGTENHYYVYDTNTNRIGRASEGLFRLVRLDDGNSSPQQLEDKLLQDCPERERAWGHEAVSEYCAARTRGLFSSRRPSDIQPFAPPLPFKQQYENQLQQLIIEVTEDCNLRCTYCTYSGQYQSQRGYSRKRLDWSTARRAVDYFLDHSTASEHRAVTFYGGEPLLNMDLIAECCARASQPVQGQLPRFQLATNGTLLAGDIARRLVALDMYVIVSLDGGECGHDANRVTTDGHGTWNRIVSNLRRLKSDYPDYFRTHIGVNCVLAPNASPKAACELFELEQELLGTGIILVSIVSDKGSDYWERNPAPEAWRSEVFSLRMKYYESLICGSPRHKFLDALFQHDLLRIQKRELSPHLPATIPLNGCCIPGTRRLFLDCDGNYHLCERIHRAAPIGNVEVGLDMAAIESLWNRYRELAQRSCLDCWLVRFCPRCFASVDTKDAEKFKEACDGLRTGFSRSLQDYCRIAEINPFAFRFMEKIVVS